MLLLLLPSISLGFSQCVFFPVALDHIMSLIFKKQKSEQNMTWEGQLPYETHMYIPKCYKCLVQI